VTAKARPRDQVVIPLASLEGTHVASDYLEFDIAIARDSLRRGFFYTPFKGDEQARQFEFHRGDGVDQFGREQVLGPEPKGGPGVWEHRVVGMCSSAPGALPRHGMVLAGGKPGRFKIYLDNLRLRHADGSTTPIWTCGKDSRLRKIADSEFFTNVRVRAVNANEVK
jgi:hypothetical protein